MKKNYKTNARHFAAFKKSAEYWVCRFGLHDWDVRYEHTQMDHGLASCDRDVAGRIAVLRLNRDWRHCRPSEADAQRSGKHEAIHLLLAAFAWLIDKRAVTEQDKEAEEHALVRRLEAVLK